VEDDGGFGLRSDQSDDGGGEVMFTVSRRIQFKNAVAVVVVATYTYLLRDPYQYWTVEWRFRHFNFTWVFNVRI